MATLSSGLPLSKKIFDWLENKPGPVHIFFVGCTGVGKSTLINCLVGEELAEVGYRLVGQVYTANVNGTSITVWESSCLQDETGNEASYIEAMKSNKCDLMVYCVSMTISRFCEHDAIRVLTHDFGKDIWENTVFVLSHANNAIRLAPRKDPHYFEKRFNNFKKFIPDVLQKFGVDKMVAESIPIIPAGHSDSEELGGGPVLSPLTNDWLSDFWFASITRMKDSGKPGMALSCVGRFKKEEEITSVHREKLLGSEQPIGYSMKKEETLMSALRNSVGQGPPGSFIQALMNRFGSFGMTADPASGGAASGVVLFSAAKYGDVGLVEMLLNNGADVNKDNGFQTPLHIAAEQGHYDVVEVLLSYNADGTTKDKKGRTAIDLIVEKCKEEDIAQLLAKKAGKSAKSVNRQWYKTLSGEKLKSLLLQKWVSITEERASTAEKRAAVAEERAIRAEETTSLAIKTAADAEERLITAEKRAVTAEGGEITSESRAALNKERANSAETHAATEKEQATVVRTFEQRANMAERDCDISKQRFSDTLKVNAVTDKSVETAEKRASIVNKNADSAKRRAVIAEERATVAEQRAYVAEERIKVAEIVTIAAEKMAADATTTMKILEERTRKAEDAVKIMQNDVRKADGQITNLVQTNSTLEERAKRDEMQIRNLTAQCRHLQEQLVKFSTPSWVLKKDDIVLTDRELGRGGWGVVKAARFCGLDVAAKLVHGAILSPHNQQLFMREMTFAAMVRHPNLLLFLGAIMDQECPFVILTELMQACLRAVLEEKRTKNLIMSRQQVSSIAMDVGRALNYLHLMKPDIIIHRDVSSANVLLEQIGEDLWKAKLSDFGSSNFARQVATEAPGSFVYAAPESLDPELQSPKMDVFSYGILLLEMSCGLFPEVKKRQELIQKLTWLAMKALVMECTTKDLKCRPSMSDVLIKLNNGIEESL